MKLTWNVMSVLLLVAALVLSACRATPQPQTVVVQATPEPILCRPQIILDGEPESLQPFQTRGIVDYFVLDQVMCQLMRYDNQLNIVPMAAESWTVVDDKTVQINLRKGIKFHNGEELTAEDVKFSLEARKDPNYAPAGREVWGNIDNVEVVDKYTVLIHLASPFAPLFDLLSGMGAAILPKSVYQEPGAAADHPIGCGPFVFKEWRKNAYIEVEAFPDYFEEGYPKAQGLRFVFLPEYNAARASLLSKQSDVLLMTNLADVPSLAKVDGLKLEATSLLVFTFVGMNVQEKPFDDERVRQAIMYAIDRDTYLKSTQSGFGDTAFIPIPKESPYYVEGFEYQQDIEKAKQLLAEAGFPNGFETKFWVPKTPQEEPMGTVFQDQLKKIGIEADMEVLDVPTYLDRCWVKQECPMTLVGAMFGADPYLTLPIYKTGGGANLWRYSNPQVDDLVVKIGQEFDVAKRRELIKQLYDITTKEAPVIWLVRFDRVSALWDHLAGFDNLPDTRYKLWKLYCTRPKE